VFLISVPARDTAPVARTTRRRSDRPFTLTTRASIILSPAQSGTLDPQGGPDMTSKKQAPDDLMKQLETEDDVEGHSAKNKHRAPDGLAPKATEDDVEGHSAKNKHRAPDGLAPKATDDDVEGHSAKNKHRAPDGLAPKATDDDVEGHMIGAMNPVMARELARAKERDIQRSTSRGNLISEAKRAIRRKE
jgi:hypothetical protein